MVSERMKDIDDETCKKLAVWFCDHALKNSSYYVQECRRMLQEYTKTGMNEEMLKNFRNAAGKPDLTKSAASEMLEGEMEKGMRQLALWEKQPRDTNARFFRVKYNQVNWEE